MDQIIQLTSLRFLEGATVTDTVFVRTITGVNYDKKNDDIIRNLAISVELVYYLPGLSAIAVTCPTNTNKAAKVKVKADLNCMVVDRRS
jgi:hypothetical protein